MLFTIFLGQEAASSPGSIPLTIFLHALVLLCPTTPQLGVVDGNAWDQSKQNPSGLKIPTTVFVPGWFRPGRKSGPSWFAVKIAVVPSHLRRSGEQIKNGQLEELFHRSPAHRQE
jgi:hypothetical protein